MLCDHDAATALLGDVLAMAERQYGRSPADEPGRKAWLYALARWACLRRLAEQRRSRQGAHTGRPAVSEERPRVSEEAAERRRCELALLAWPEAAGTTPEQREALELAVRHGLGAREVAAVLGMDATAARELLAAAACEVERTRAALAVVESGNCPSVARLTGDHRVLLSAALRTELVRHVDDCPRCRRAAERAGAGGPWPGSAVSPATLPLVEAPRAAAYIAMLHVPRGASDRTALRAQRLPPRPEGPRRPARPAAGPRGDHHRRGDGRRRAGPRAVGGVPRGAGDGRGRTRRNRGHRERRRGGRGAGGPALRPLRERGQRPGRTGSPFTAPSTSPDVSVEVISAGTPPPPSRPGMPAPGRLTVEAEPSGDTTRITLRASGGSPVTWSAWTNARWLYVSHTSGTLRPGESVTIYVTVDRAREPVGGVERAGGSGPVRSGDLGPRPRPPPPADAAPPDIGAPADAALDPTTVGPPVPDALGGDPVPDRAALVPTGPDPVGLPTELLRARAFTRGGWTGVTGSCGAVTPAPPAAASRRCRAAHLSGAGEEGCTWGWRPTPLTCGSFAPRRPRDM